MKITGELIRKLNLETNAGIQACKTALQLCDSYEEARGYIKGQEQVIFSGEFTRLECISNQVGREFTKYCKGNKLSMSVQDNKKTLKLFIDEEE